MQETILEKYKRCRSDIRHGDTILFHGTKAVARIIQECDADAYWNHIGIVVSISGVLYIIDSNAPGVHPERLSVRIRFYAEGEGDFTVRRSRNKTKVEIDIALYNVQQSLEEVGDVKYDFINGLKSLLNRRFKTWFKIKPNKKELICSMFTYPYDLELDKIHPATFEKTLFFPQDSLRYAKNVKKVC